MRIIRTIVISDFHGYNRTFEVLLSLTGYNPVCDKLVLLGDYVDGGPASLELVMRVRQLTENPNVKAIGGNHDDMFLRWLDKKEYPFLKYTSYSEEINFLRKLPNYWEDDRLIYVHGGIDPTQNDWKLTLNKIFRWIRERFHRNDGKLPTNKTIVFGHEICSRLHKDDTNFNHGLVDKSLALTEVLSMGSNLMH
ncbi:metallophosphoesterase [Paenibacillus chartarius]|uniref:Metallophosphoesterase n=1 Tax=Paenibacillus chartarius TaxID=747481 RepID=A0ABV6DFH5_9BACL